MVSPLVLIDGNLLAGDRRRLRGGDLAARREAEDVDRPRPVADLAQAVADRLGGDLARPRAASSGVLAEGQERGQRRGVGAAGAVRGAVGVALRRRSRRRRSPSKKRSTSSSLWPPVTTAACGPSASTAAGQLLLRARLLAEPGQHPRLGDVRRRRPSPAAAASRPAPACASSSSRTAPLSATITGSRTTGAALRPARALDHRVDRLRRAEHPDLDRVDADVRGDRPDLRDDHLAARPARPRSTADRVLRRDRGDRRHPVHAAARERLQVGLDPGAAAGVRAGDREDGRGRARAMAPEPRATVAGDGSERRASRRRCVEQVT